MEYEKFKKEERKKQLRNRYIVAAVMIAMNLAWLIPLSTEVYANYTAGNYIDYWKKPRIYEKPVVYEVENLEVSLGEFRITAYCQCKECCKEWADKRPVDDFGNVLVIGAAGILLEEGKHIAVDPNVIPYGTKVIIEGYGEYLAADRGVSGKEIDIYMEDHERANEHGVKYAEVYVVWQ